MKLLIEKSRDLFNRKTKKTVRLISHDEAHACIAAVTMPDSQVTLKQAGIIKNITIDPSQILVELQAGNLAKAAQNDLRIRCIEALSNLPGVAGIRIQMLGSHKGASTETTPAKNTDGGLGQVKNIIAVASGKGGVGKSTSSVQLALALQKAGNRVGLLDADIYGPSLMLMTKAPRATQLESDQVIPPETLGGIKIISIAMFSEKLKANVMRGPMVAQLIKQFLTTVKWGELDYLIIDYPPGTGDIQLTLSQHAKISGAVIVTTPQEVALIDARKAISMFEQVKIPVLGILETMSFFECDGCDKKHYIFGKGGGGRVAAEFGLPLLGEVPHDPELVKLCDQGNPIAAMTRPAGAVFAVASDAVADIIEDQGEASLSGFSLEWSK